MMRYRDAAGPWPDELEKRVQRARDTPLRPTADGLSNQVKRAAARAKTVQLCRLDPNWTEPDTSEDERGPDHWSIKRTTAHEETTVTTANKTITTKVTVGRTATRGAAAGTETTPGHATLQTWMGQGWIDYANAGERYHPLSFGQNALGDDDDNARRVDSDDDPGYKSDDDLLPGRARVNGREVWADEQNVPAPARNNAPAGGDEDGTRNNGWFEPPARMPWQDRDDARRDGDRDHVDPRKHTYPVLLDNYLFEDSPFYAAITRRAFRIENGRDERRAHLLRQGLTMIGRGCAAEYPWRYLLTHRAGSRLLAKWTRQEERFGQANLNENQHAAMTWAIEMGTVFNVAMDLYGAA